VSDTEELIEALVDSATPVRRLRPPLVRAAIWLLLAAFVLTLVKTILIIKGVDQNWAQVIQGTLIIVVVMIGGLAIRQRRRT